VWRWGADPAAVSWNRFQLGRVFGRAERKGILISSLREHLGYGGIIHNFMNYVLRQDPAYLLETRAQIAPFYAAVDAFKQLDLLVEEKAAPMRQGLILSPWSSKALQPS